MDSLKPLKQLIVIWGVIMIFIVGYQLGIRTGKAEGQLIQVEKKVEVLKENYYPPAN